MDFVVRAARLEDLDPILSLLYQLSPKKEAGSRDRLKSAFSKILSNPDYTMVVCEDSGKIAGTSTLLTQPNLSHGGRPYGHIENVVTDQSRRKSGIGKLMVEFLVNKSRQANCYKVILDCQPDEELKKFILDFNHVQGNSAFYQKCGFKKTGAIEMRMDP